MRILSATHKDLAAEVEKGCFRQDLFYRINVIELKVPSLRERSDDVPALAANLLARIADDYQVAVPELSNEAISSLRAYHFPGNVRELQNILERAITLCENDVITVDDLALTTIGQYSMIDAQNPVPGMESAAIIPNEDKSVSTDGKTAAAGSLPEDADSLESYLEDIEKNVIVEALEATRWNKTAAAKKLGITFRALRYKLKKLNLD